MKRVFSGILILGLGLTGCRSNAPETFIGIQGDGPWTKLSVPTKDQDFKFVIMSDRTGGARNGVFRSAIGKVNLLQPDFVMCVGDLIEGYTTDEELLKKQWDNFDGMVETLEAPFFYLPGNHDYQNPVQANLWAERYKKSYYHFVYKDVLMLCINSEETATGKKQISPEQAEYFKKVLAENKTVRWTFAFLHEPLWLYEEKGRSTGWKEISDALNGREYTVFAGHTHNYVQYTRRGRDHIILATTGGGSDLSGPFFGRFDHIVAVSVSGAEPAIANLMLDGIHGVDIRDEETSNRSTEWIEKIRIQAEMAPVGPVVADALSGEIKITNDSDVPVRFEFENNSVELRLAQEMMTLNPGEMGQIALTLTIKEPTPIDLLPLSKINWRTVFTPEGYEETDRSGSLIVGIDTEHVCPVVNKTPAIDGDLSEWNALPYFADQKDRVRYPGNWSGSTDNSLKFGVARDEDYLYIAVHVVDDEVGINMKKKPFAKDSVSIYLDARPEEERMSDLTIGTQFKTHMIFILSPGETPDTPDVYLEERLPEGTRIACVQTQNGYNAEMAVPLTYLDEMQGTPWNSFRLNMIVNDPDTHGTSTLRWRPDWYGKNDFKNAGTFIKSNPPDTNKLK